jgi:predicted O-linked N-acetylglucosamine transferase (SPINDLY family)
LDQTSEALPLLTAAAAADPSRPDFRVNLANAWNRSGDAARAISSYRQALALDPSLAEAWLNLAQTAQLSRRLDQAIVLYRRGLVQTPNDAAAQSGLGSVLYESGLPRAALAAYRRSLALVQNPKVHSGYLYLLEFDARASPERHQIERRRWAALHLPAPRPDRPLVTDPNPERQLTIGIVTPTLDSGTGMLVEPFITDRDRGMFRCLIYSNMAPAGETGPRLAASVDAWRTLGTMPDDQATEIIRGDRVDILVDLANHVGGQRLGVFARRAAPIQVSGWCHGLGTGLATMDFVIADPVALPEAERRFYSETIMDVACRAAFAAPPISPDVAPAPSSLGGPFSFGHFGRPAKVGDEMVALWARLLAAVSGSRLVLKSGSDTGTDRILRGLAQGGIGRERIRLLGPTSRFDTLAEYRHVDVALDTAPVAGPLTLWEALWMGVPTLTLAGSTQSARGSMSILSAAGLTDFIAENGAAYLAMGTRLASVPHRLVALRKTLRARVAESSAGNVAITVSEMQRVFRQMWRLQTEQFGRARTI